MGCFTGRTVKCDKLMANAYILYMMAGSLFDKAKLINKMIEGNLRNQYRELAKEKQEQQEVYIENRLERFLGEFMAIFSQMRSDVYVKKQDGLYYFWFRTGLEEIIAAIDGNGRIKLDTVYQMTETEWHKLYIQVYNLKKIKKGI